ncbi:VWA domain-containing protein [Aequorivita sp. SDUM287046]|uniref:VWA domain-containing protein n=1 Tax=Aequorivita aurantiaca TaxID=3053356 RepID=A0ABT8DF42_9FLAO|nr:VWA domain-containing protein [Aequorivita aurantiaca]MDN3723463.1 VWA domain-containing protein [Aequorivita aurantiaca]
MTTETILLISLAGVISIALAVFMYGYKSKQTRLLRWVFGILRFITLFSILILIINPKFKSETYTIEKPKLPVLIDNSASVGELGQTENVSGLIQKLKENSELNDKFDVSYFSFGNDFSESDSLNFEEKNTNISKALASTNELFKNQTAPTIIITDGNQTLGSDYEFSSATYKNSIYPVILGDSIKYTDLKIEQLNTNRYAFLKNQFPVEVILTYSGSIPVNSDFVITQGATTVYRTNVSFSENESSKTLNFTLNASSVGLQKYTAQLLPLADEKNKTNNSKQFAVEVMDQATNVLVVSKISHPDLGALKKSITSNEQRTISFKKPAEAASILNDFQLVILYQPDRNFASVFDEIEKLNKNTWVISGLQTDWYFLNGAQDNFNKEASTQSDDIQAELNSNYGTFAVENIGFDDFPPLQTEFGALVISVPNEVMLEQTVSGISNGNPLLATMEINGKRDAIWDGEGFWRWRANSFLQTESFQSFDDFVGNLVQYLASNKRRSRLEVSAETFYYNNNPIKISAQYFDKNYVFDSRASLNITVKNAETEQQTNFPMLLRNNYFEVDLNSLPAGEYNYTVSVANEAVSSSGNFTILDFNVEQQFLNADVSKLNRIAQNTGGKAYFTTQYDALIDALLENPNFQNIERSEQKVVPLIDWKYLLALIVLALAAEWFIRKYNGLI